MLSSARAGRQPSLGVIFLTLYIDLVGFSILFPLLPDLVESYLHAEGGSGLLGQCLGFCENSARALGLTEQYAPVLLGGFVSSLFSLVQFLSAPFWGGLSDRLGRRPVLLWTVCGTSLGYLLWIFSGTLWVFLLSRLLCGAFGGNLSVATAAVADVTNREERSKAMGLVGAAFGLGLVTGPMLGALSYQMDLPQWRPELAHLGIHRFSAPAALAFVISLLSFFWVLFRFGESLPVAKRSSSAAVTPAKTQLHALAAILGLRSPALRKINGVAFLYSIAFVAMEMTLTYLAAQRFSYSARENGWLLAFLGFCSILTQGLVVRRLLRLLPETRVLHYGLVFSALGLLGLAFAFHPSLLYFSLVLTALGSGLVNPASTGLISLYAEASEQGAVLGIFRSIGALSRAFTPLLAGLIYWSFGATLLYLASAVLALVALAAAAKLPQPRKHDSS